MLWVKICGMTNPEDAIVATEAGADAIGLIFAPSKRQVSVAQAKEITRQLPKTMDKVGVFYNESAIQIEDVAAQAGLTAVQLHGDETPDFAHKLFEQGSRHNRSRMRVFKTLHVTAGIEAIARGFLADGAVDGFLFDSVVQDATTGETLRGGTGQTFDWQMVNELFPAAKSETRIIVAGGLKPANVGEAIRMTQPWGVDVCSGVEREPGKKDWAKVKAFIAAARDARG